jgi:hypothetical protein
MAGGIAFIVLAFSKGGQSSQTVYLILSACCFVNGFWLGGEKA